MDIVSSTYISCSLELINHICCVAVEACLALCAECFIGCIEGLVQYFNRYAYIEIGMFFEEEVAVITDNHLSVIWEVVSQCGERHLGSLHGQRC